MGKTKKREKAHKLWKAIDFEVVSRCYDTHPRKYGAEAAKILDRKREDITGYVYAVGGIAAFREIGERREGARYD